MFNVFFKQDNFPYSDKIVSMPANSTAHILLIEDEQGIAISLKNALEKESFQVTWKDTGGAGIDFVKNNSCDLIILDVRLPDGTGFDFCRKMRSLKIRQPILMLTVRNEEMDKVLGLEMGADDYMTKPFSFRELLSRIRALLRRAYGELSDQNSDILYIRDLVIDLSQGRVFRGEMNLNLSPTEYRLLVYLTRHLEQATSRSQILRAVWDAESNMIDEGVVNVYIRRLRGKIELDPKKPEIIMTVPGIGYRLTKK